MRSTLAVVFFIGLFTTFFRRYLDLTYEKLFTVNWNGILTLILVILLLLGLSKCRNFFHNRLEKKLLKLDQDIMNCSRCIQKNKDRNINSNTDKKNHKNFERKLNEEFSYSSETPMMYLVRQSTI